VRVTGGTTLAVLSYTSEKAQRSIIILLLKLYALDLVTYSKRELLLKL
jgi:hypothetical protein